MDQLAYYLGRLHPMLVHLPIGFFVLYALLEFCAWLPRHRSLRWLPECYARQRTFVLGILAVTAIATAMTGWLRGNEGGYEAQALDSHRLAGLLFAGGTLLMFCVHLRGGRRVYVGLGLASSAAIVLAGHWGSVLTHGPDYFVWPEAGSSVTRFPAAALVTDPAQAAIFADVIGPVLREHCVGCHGASKSNGNLRLDSFALLSAGGKNGPVIINGDATRSSLVRRIHLPLAEKEHMPPRTKPQLREDEIALLEWWIDVGAPSEQKLAEFELPAFVVAALEPRFPGVAKGTPSVDRTAILAVAAEVATQHGLSVRPLTLDKPWLMVNARLKGRGFGDADLAALAPIASAIQWLDLGETAVSDAGLANLAGMNQLRRLHLDRTALTDAGLARLGNLKSLEYLNLYGTAVTDAGIGQLAPLRQLRALYVWETKVTPAAVRKLEERVVDRRRLDRLNREMVELQRRIRAEEFRADFGMVAERPPAPAVESPDPTVARPNARDGKTGRP